MGILVGVFVYMIKELYYIKHIVEFVELAMSCYRCKSQLPDIGLMEYETYSLKHLS